MVKTATVAMAGRTSGSTSRKKIAYSDSPSMRAGVLQVVGHLPHELRQDEDGERQALRGIDQDQRGQRVDQPARAPSVAGWRRCRGGSGS